MTGAATVCADTFRNRPISRSSKVRRPIQFTAP